jgi:hypothetical protein
LTLSDVPSATMRAGSRASRDRRAAPCRNWRFHRNRRCPANASTAGIVDLLSAIQLNVSWRENRGFARNRHSPEPRPARPSPDGSHARGLLTLLRWVSEPSSSDFRRSSIMIRSAPGPAGVEGRAYSPDARRSRAASATDRRGACRIVQPRDEAQLFELRSGLRSPRSRSPLRFVRQRAVDSRTRRDRRTRYRGPINPSPAATGAAAMWFLLPGFATPSRGRRFPFSWLRCLLALAGSTDRQQKFALIGISLGGLLARFGDSLLS